MFDLYRSALEKNLSRETEEAKARPILPQNLRFLPPSPSPAEWAICQQVKAGSSVIFCPIPIPSLSFFFCCSAKLPALEKKTQKETGNLFPSSAVGLPPPRSFLFLLRTWDCPRRGRNSAPPFSFGWEKRWVGEEEAAAVASREKKTQERWKTGFSYPFPFQLL